MYWQVAIEISFKDIFIFSSGGHAGVLVEGIMRNISVKLF